MTRCVQLAGLLLVSLPVLACGAPAAGAAHKDAVGELGARLDAMNDRLADMQRSIDAVQAELDDIKAERSRPSPPVAIPPAAAVPEPGDDGSDDGDAPDPTVAPPPKPPRRAKPSSAHRSPDLRDPFKK